MKKQIIMFLPHQLNQLKVRNNLRKIYGRRAVMLPSKLSRSQESILLLSRGLDSTQPALWSFSTNQTNLFPSRDPISKTTIETLSFGAMYHNTPEIVDILASSTKRDRCH